MSKQLNEFIHQLKEQLELFLSISLGIFLFVLFFQPFELEHFDFNNRLLLLAGLSGIVFLLMIFIQVVFHPTGSISTIRCIMDTQTSKGMTTT